jgi:hypothetical protein
MTLDAQMSMQKHKKLKKKTGNLTYPKIKSPTSISIKYNEGKEIPDKIKLKA